MASNRYNLCVRLQQLHDWNLTTSEARDLQNRLATEVTRVGSVIEPRFIAGVDVSMKKSRGTATAAAVVLGYPELNLVETKIFRGEIDFPYVPGLLSFREAPLILQACEQLTHTPDLIIVDGQGIAHPRCLGIAAHLDFSLISRPLAVLNQGLCGTHKEPVAEAGNYEELVDDDEPIGVVLRTKDNTKPDLCLYRQ